jgi:predicted nucleotidyltransferase
VNHLQRALLRLHADLRQLKVKWAVVGGFAVGVASRPRTTFDIDAVVSVANDREAEGMVHGLSARGYTVDRLLEQEAMGCLAGARLIPPSEVGTGAPIDLLFASSGIETEIAAQADHLEIMKGVVLPVARRGHLIALKVLAEQPDRPQDRSDALALLAAASSEDRELARSSLVLIERRGFHRGKDLQRVLGELVQESESKRR